MRGGLEGLRKLTRRDRVFNFMVDADELKPNTSKGMILYLEDLSVSFDGFKAINDRLGHPAGDTVLQTMADRLRAGTRSSDLVARMGGDEFTVLLSGIHSPSDAELVAARMLHAMGETVEIQAQKLSPSASVGIAVYPGDGQTTDDLRKRADAALYAAKGAGARVRRGRRSARCAVPPVPGAQYSLTGTR